MNMLKRHRIRIDSGVDMARLTFAAVAAVTLSALWTAPVRADQPKPMAVKTCSAPADLVMVEGPLNHFAKALRAGQPVTIVALGSSSTWGAGATSRANGYPARLEAELRSEWPGVKLEVVNAGVNGDLAADMLGRIDRDVVARKPQLVIWQTGVNDAMNGVPVERFRDEVRQGIARIRGAGADVMLLDPQYAPRVERLPLTKSYVDAMQAIGAETGVALVQRFRVMKHLIDSAQFTVATLFNADQLHLNDSAYACLGHLMALSLDRAVEHQSGPIR
ncbi:MAG: SGNH/GDSL hydrolase family protein [Hyphomicrobium sp.]|nr:SGNH/GDSL hydrolase family protein [Hyphomicrobium sp.]